MFLKPFRKKPQTAMKNSDRKKLRSDVEKQFPNLTSDQVIELIPGKGDMTQMKVETHTDEHILLYCLGQNPVFFEYFKKLYPSVYTLWKVPDLLPVFKTYPEVFPRLAGGADLMLPGVIFKGEPHPKMFGSLRKGDLCIISLKGNKAPVALGEAVMSSEDMYMSALKGKGVKIIHILGDHLWKLGDKLEPPQIDEDNDISDEKVENALESQVSEGGIQGNEQPNAKNSSAEKDNPATVAADEEPSVASEDGASSAELMVETESAESSGGQHCEASADIPVIDDMDSLLRYCFKCALKKSIKKSDLPLLTSTFLKVHMQPFCPTGKHIDVKKSSFKKFAKFLQQMQSEEFIKLKELSKGVDSISEFNRSHPDLKDLVAPDLPAPEKEIAEETDYEPPEITEVFCITTATLPLFKNQGFSKGDSLTLTELRKQITDYVKTNNLQTEAGVSQVQLDPVLAEIALLRNEGDRSLLPWNDLIIRITDKMQPGCLIKLAGQQPVLKKGKMEPIKLNVVQRGSQKKVTVIENLEFYGVDPRVFAHTVQITMACSATTVDSEQKNHGVNVVVQGNQMSFISKLLLDKYKIPRKYIQGLEKVPKAKKK